MSEVTPENIMKLGVYTIGSLVVVIIAFYVLAVAIF